MRTILLAIGLWIGTIDPESQRRPDGVEVFAPNRYPRFVVADSLEGTVVWHGHLLAPPYRVSVQYAVMPPDTAWGMVFVNDFPLRPRSARAPDWGPRLWTRRARIGKPAPLAWAESIADHLGGRRLILFGGGTIFVPGAGREVLAELDSLRRGKPVARSIIKDLHLLDEIAHPWAVDSLLRYGE